MMMVAWELDEIERRTIIFICRSLALSPARVSNSQAQGLRSPDYFGHVQAEIIIVQHQPLVFGGTASVMYS